MRACTISLACEAPVLLTVLVTLSAVLGSRGCATPVRGSAPCPHPCLHGAAVRLGLRGCDHRWLLWGTAVWQTAWWSPVMTAPWPAGVVAPRWGDTHLPLAMQLPHSPWKPALGGVLLHPKCKLCMLGSTLCWQANQWNTLSEILLCRVGLLCPTLWSWGAEKPCRTHCPKWAALTDRSHWLLSWQQYVCLV